MNIIFLLTYFFAFANTVDCYTSVILKMIEHIHTLDPVRTRFRDIPSHLQKAKWITQRVDNFNMSDSRKWKMRYFENGNYFKPRGPVFIIVGGQCAISPYFITRGLIHDMAQDYNGYLFIVEHRYYGKSQLFKTLTVENLKYLSARQALIDLAYFIKFIKRTYSNLRRSKIVLMGGSYAGTIVTWFQEKFPNLVEGAWASSAPLMVKVEFKEYYQNLGMAISKIVGDRSCYKTVSKVFKDLEEFLVEKPEIILKIFNVCDNFNPKDKFDVIAFNYLLSVFFTDVLQGGSIQFIKRTCHEMEMYESPFEVIYNFISTKFVGTGDCLDISFSTIIKDLSYETVYEANTEKNYALRQWIYQSCFEFGWFETTSSKNHPFGTHISLDFFYTLCNKLFGPLFEISALNKNVLKVNAYFGGLHPRVTNTIFTQGELDPWHLLGVQVQNNVSTVIPMYSRCKDIYSINSRKDTKEMISFKRRIQAQLRIWLGLCKCHDDCYSVCDDYCGEDCDDDDDDDCENLCDGSCDDSCDELSLALMYSLI